MEISYNKLWKLLIDLNMKKKDLQEISGVSSASPLKNLKISVETMVSMSLAVMTFSYSSALL